MSNVIDFESEKAAKKNGGWISGNAVCLSCNNEWIAAAPAGTENLECPSCHTFHGLFKGVPNRKDVAALKCDCGCQVFVIYVDEYICCYLCGKLMET